MSKMLSHEYKDIIWERLHAPVTPSLVGPKEQNPGSLLAASIGKPTNSRIRETLSGKRKKDWKMAANVYLRSLYPYPPPNTHKLTWVCACAHTNKYNVHIQKKEKRILKLKF